MAQQSTIPRGATYSKQLRSLLDVNIDESFPGYDAENPITWGEYCAWVEIDETYCYLLYGRVYGQNVRKDWPDAEELALFHAKFGFKNASIKSASGNILTADGKSKLEDGKVHPVQQDNLTPGKERYLARYGRLI